MLPLVNQLFEHTRVRMLRDKTRSQEFNALARDLSNDWRVVEKPPTAKRHQVTELARGYTKFMLIFARQDSRQETDVRILRAHALKGTDVRPTHTVTCGPESWIHAAADTNHHGQSEGVLSRGWQDNFTD